jgi:4'-phosphopantetheinyl transferase
MDPVAVDVAYWDLAGLRSRLAALSAFLTPDETARAARFAIPALRERYVLAHGILRETLAALTGDAPAALRFERGPDGKPALIGVREVEFNLSKSGDGLLIATARNAAIGVDLEPLRPNSEARAIAARWFSAGERAILEQLGGGDFDRAFTTFWVRKEALLKAVGTGLQGSLRIDTGDPAPNETARPVTLGASRLWLADLAPRPGWIAAVAAEKPMTLNLTVHA